MYNQGKYNQGLILVILVIKHSLIAEGFTHCFVQPIASQFASQYIEELAEKQFIYTAPIRRVTKSYTHCVAQTNAPALVCEFQFSRLTDIFVSSLNLPVHANQNTKV